MGGAYFFSLKVCAIIFKTRGIWLWVLTIRYIAIKKCTLYKMKPGVFDQSLHSVSFIVQHNYCPISIYMNTFRSIGLLKLNTNNTLAA